MLNIWYQYKKIKYQSQYILKIDLPPLEYLNVYFIENLTYFKYYCLPRWGEQGSSRESFQVNQYATPDLQNELCNDQQSNSFNIILRAFNSSNTCTFVLL